MEQSLKSKIEIQWSDISAIRATFSNNQPDTLEIEVQQVPQVFQETNPEPRKHTLWHATGDFTKGQQASKFRRHRLEFPPGTLGRHYEKLLSCDPRLLSLSTLPFPSRSPPFPTAPAAYLPMHQSEHQQNLAAFNTPSSTESQLPYYGVLPPTSRPFPLTNGLHPSPSPFAGLNDQGHMFVSQTAHQTQDMQFTASTSHFNPSFPSVDSEAVMFASNTTPRDSLAMFNPNNWQLGEISGQMASSISHRWAGDTSFFPDPNHTHSHTKPELGLNNYLPKNTEMDETPTATGLSQLQNYQPFAQCAPGLSSTHVFGNDDDGQNII